MSSQQPNNYIQLNSLHLQVHSPAIRKLHELISKKYRNVNILYGPATYVYRYNSKLLTELIVYNWKTNTIKIVGKPEG